MNADLAGTAIAARPSFLAKVERGLFATCEAVAVALLASEIVLLSVAVVARYLLHTPVTWVDELNSFTFLWLGMLGTVIASHRGKHLRLSGVIGLLKPGTARQLALLAIGLEIALLAVLLRPALEHLEDATFLDSPLLSLPVSLRVASVLVALPLIILVDVLRFLREARNLRETLVAAGSVALLALCLWLLGPALTAMGNYNLIIFFGLVLIACMLIGMPIVFAFLLASVAYLASTSAIPLSVVIDRLESGMSNPLLLSIPLFVFLGLVIEMTGLAQAMIALLAAWLGAVRGGLSYVLIGAMYLVSGISGAKTADMAAIAPALFPEMEKRGYDRRSLVSLLAASAVMAETIPPSLVLIAVGSVTSVSIAALFAGGLLPAFVAALALCLMIFFQSRRQPPPAVPPPATGSKWTIFLLALPALALPVIIRTAVVEGVATATEVSTIGILYSFAVGLLIYKRFDWRRLYPMLVDTAALTGVIIVVIGAATCMSWALAQSGFSRDLAAWISAIPGGAVSFMILSIVVFIVFGSILEGIPALVLFAPLLFPIARALGIHEVHYAIVAIMAMGLGLYTPPFGVGYYIACAIGEVDPAKAMGKVWPYLGILLVSIVLIAFFPSIVTVLIPR
jgi:tripartite ATP-independent transporter DctM subunit